MKAQSLISFQLDTVPDQQNDDTACAGADPPCMSN